eukprot:3765840-Rhodomonas_salina.1
MATTSIKAGALAHLPLHNNPPLIMNGKVFFPILAVVCGAAGAFSLKRMDAVTDGFKDPARNQNI